MAGDYSPLSVDSSNGPRQAPPALVVAMAAGLASMDMPIPQVAAWEWQSWKFPKAIKAGDTVYARWTLTQKRAPVGGGRTAIAVWRVDVHTTDGAVCAEGEVGASVFRSSTRQAAESPAAVPAAPSRRRRRRRAGSADAAPTPPPASVPAPAPPAQPAARNERGSGSRRRRRRRTSSSAQPNGGESAPAPPAPEPPPALAQNDAVAPAPRGAANPLTRVMKRLRRN